jgi:carbon monoxide dehydrogenase subunit G/molybdopterin biosynthesis enzyme
MHLEGQVTIQAPRDRVWRFLTDPEKVSACAPGLESLEILDTGRRFRAVASVGFGSVKATFVSDAEWLDLEEPTRARMKVHGTAPGSAADVMSEMRLEDGPDRTTAMRWTAEISVMGTIASIAARLMGSVAKRLTDAFFDSVRRRIETEREFRFGPVPLEEAEGKVLGHNVTGLDGRPALRKGRPLSATDVARLRELGRTAVYVAQPGTDDVGEDAAARRVGEGLKGPGLRLSGTASGRVNLQAESLGVLRVDVARLVRVNEKDGVTVATLAADTVVRPGQVVATVKIIPFAVPAAAVRAAEQVAAEGPPVLRLDVLAPRTVGLVLLGAPAAHERLRRDFEPPLRARVEAFGSVLGPVDVVALEDAEDEATLAEALDRQASQGRVGLILLAGETAVVDRNDLAPRAIERAGGEVACFGAPVDPGNLLLVAYLGPVPILGAPGCARSRKVNVVDWVLPRLLAGERMGRPEIVALGHGGLLEDVPERPMPRSDLG